MKEIERLILPGLCRKPIKPLTQDLHVSRRHRAPSRGGLQHRVPSQESLRSPGRTVSKTGLCAAKNQLRRERERKKDTGSQALMEQRCFIDFSVSIERLWYKKFLSTVLKIRKPNVQQQSPREQGFNNGHKVRRQSTSQERGSRLSSFVVKRMFTKGDSSLSHTMTSVPGSSVLFHLKRNKGLVRNSTQESSC